MVIRCVRRPCVTCGPAFFRFVTLRIIMEIWDFCLEISLKNHWNFSMPVCGNPVIGIFKSSYDNVLRWMPQDLTDDKSTVVQVMAWCRQATSLYLNQCWPRSPTPYSVTRPQWVNSTSAGTGILWENNTNTKLNTKAADALAPCIYGINHVNYAGLTCHCDIRRRISTTWAISWWTNKTQCEYIYSFCKVNSA